MNHYVLMPVPNYWTIDFVLLDLQTKKYKIVGTIKADAPEGTYSSITRDSWAAIANLEAEFLFKSGDKGEIAEIALLFIPPGFKSKFRGKKAVTIKRPGILEATFDAAFLKQCGIKPDEPEATK